MDAATKLVHDALAANGYTCDFEYAVFVKRTDTNDVYRIKWQGEEGFVFVNLNTGKGEF